MTATADDAAVERAFEALLAGRPVPPSAEGLAAFTGAVRAVAERPGRPSAALAELLATGSLAHPETVAPEAAAPARRRRTRMFLPALIAKLASLGAVAKAATVAGVVVAGFTTAGFTGALPTSVQHDFATVVSTVTPLDAPDPTGTATPTPTTEPAATTAEPSDAADPSGATKAEDGAGASTHPENFGGTVSGMAHESDGKPGVDGGAVSSLAHERNQERHGGSAAATATSTPAPTAAPERHSSAASTSGHGHGSH